MNNFALIKLKQKIEGLSDFEQKKLLARYLYEATDSGRPQATDSGEQDSRRDAADIFINDESEDNTIIDANALTKTQYAHLSAIADSIIGERSSS